MVHSSSCLWPKIPDSQTGPSIQPHSTPGTRSPAPGLAGAGPVGGGGLSVSNQSFPSSSLSFSCPLLPAQRSQPLLASTESGSFLLALPFALRGVWTLTFLSVSHLGPPSTGHMAWSSAKVGRQLDRCFLDHQTNPKV